jgi:hypothetical protein
MAAETLRLSNWPEANLVELTKLNADAAAAASSITVQNAQGLAADNFICIGRLGSEQAEIIKISSVSSTTVNLATSLSFAQKKYSDVTKLRGDKIRVYRATNVDGTVPSDANFALLDTVTIEADQNYTEYTAATGGSGYFWKQTFYHSVGLTETELGDSDAVRGGDYGHYATIEDIRKEAGFQDNPELTDENIHDRRNDAESQVNGCLKAAQYNLPLSSVPSVIENITKLLAAGYVLLQDYGVGADGTNKEGQAKINLAESLLTKIKKHEIILTNDIDQTESASTSYMSGWPDDTTESAAELSGGGNAAFRMLRRL